MVSVTFVWSFVPHAATAPTITPPSRRDTRTARRLRIRRPAHRLTALLLFTLLPSRIAHHAKGMLQQHRRRERVHVSLPSAGRAFHLLHRPQRQCRREPFVDEFAGMTGARGELDAQAPR